MSLLESYGKSSAIAVGPWGGQAGNHWDDGVYSTLRQLEISHGAGIDSIRLEYDWNGTSNWSEKHGGSGGQRSDRVKLDYPDEYLTSVHGYYGSLQSWGPVFLRSLTFKTNKKTYGPYGVEQGTYFTLPIVGAKVVGFHGRCGWYLDAIGVHLQPLHNPTPPSSAIVQSQRRIVQETEKYEYSMLQGSLGKNYDLILAVRHKDHHGGNTLVPNNLHRQNSKSNEHHAKVLEVEPKKQVPTVPPPAIVEKVPSKKMKGVVTYGPWGGNGGSVFDDGIYDGIKQIKVSRNVGIVTIRVCYVQNGQLVWGTKNGGTGGFKSERIILDYPSEILTHITGYHGPTMIMGPNVIKSLTFHTTKGKYGPYGEEQGQSFTSKLKEGMIVGFHGRRGLFVDAIGVHVLEGKLTPGAISPTDSHINHPHPVPVNDLIADSNNTQWSFKLGKKGLTEEAVQRVVKDPAPYGPGPWGGDGGKPWDDGVFTGIKQIILTRTEGICSIEFEYDRNGQSVWSVKHGGNGGKITDRIKLEYPHEVLTCISGYYGPVSKIEHGKVIKSLTFYTTRRKVGPFGEELGNFFTSTTTEGKVVGFHGRSGMYLDAIGVHMQHWLGNNRTVPKPSSLMKMFY